MKAFHSLLYTPHCILAPPSIYFWSIVPDLDISTLMMAGTEIHMKAQIEGIMRENYPR
jgi:hypothetical protein